MELFPVIRPALSTLVFGHQPVYPIVSRQSVQNIMSKMATYLFIRSGFSKKIRKKE
jgi:hypothetical protein